MLWMCLFPSQASAAFGLTSDTDSYTVDTGAGLVFKIRRTDNGVSTQSAGDLMSMVYNGVEYEDLTKGSQLNSGFDFLYTGVSAVTVTGELVDADTIKITVVAGDLTHYYLARRGFAHIYMATYFTTEPSTLGLCRFIVRIPSTLLTNGPAPSDIRNNTGAIESGDIFGMADGTTRSKHYSNMRLKDWSYIGATGTNVGIWMLRSNHEGDSGGPFYRSLLNQCGTDQEITYIINYGEAQTEPFRTSILNGPYVLDFTTGETPAAIDTSWVANAGLIGYVGSAGRGSVSSSGIIGRDTQFAYTVGFSNANAQYWTDASAIDGSFSKADILPGTYTMSIYKNEFVVDSRSVTVTAGITTTLNPIVITGDPSATLPLWRIGNWDGTPTEFLNGDKITTMHPSDVRMSTWTPGTYVIGTSNPATGMPCYQWKDVNGTQVVQFDLAASQLIASTVRIGITTAFAGGRPNITVNSWTSANPSPSIQPNSRTLTVGSYRGNNTTFTYNVPSSALVAGTNLLYIFPISGSSGVTYLSPGYSLDCIDIYQGTAVVVPVPAVPTAITATGGDQQVTLNWTAASGATSYTIQRSSTPGGPYTTLQSGVAQTSFLDSGLTNGTNYYYVIRSANSSGLGVASAEVRGTPVDPLPPVAPTGLTAQAYHTSALLAWIAVPGAQVYYIKRSLASGASHTFVQGVSGPSFSDFGLVDGTTYYYVVSAGNVAGEGSDSAEVAVTPVASKTVTFVSTAAEDGYVTASSSANTAGGSTSSTSTLRIGDSSSNRQYRTILSFDTSTLPEDAEVTSSVLKLRRSSLTGITPFTLLGTEYADLKAGTGFNGSTSLENADFQATADASKVATMSSAANNGDLSTGPLSTSGLAGLNRTGTSQFRLYFSTATNNDSTNNYISWNSGKDTTASYRPTLDVVYRQQAPSTQPMASLRFDENTGTTAADSTRNGWNGVLQNGPGWVAGEINNGVNLDGVNDYVSLPTGVVGGLTDFTIACWVKWNGTSGWQRIFDFGTGSTVYMFLTPLNKTTNTVRFAMTTGGGTTEQVIDGSAALPVGVWTHVAVTLSGTTGTLYLNGAVAGSNTAMTLRPASLGGTTLNYLGKSQFSTDPYFNGIIDEFQIYRRALTSDEMFALSASSTAPAGLGAAAGDGLIHLTWNASPGATGYNLKRSTVVGGPYTVVAANLTSTNYGDTYVSNGTTYHYVISRLNGVGESANSAPVDGRPVAPFNNAESQTPLFAMAGSNGSVTVSSSVIGHIYQLQYSDDLSANVWQDLGTPVNGTGSSLLFSFQIDAIPSRFYRVLIQQ